MSRQPTNVEFSNLGEYLRETRINLNIDLITVVEETRISLKSLQAIEENDFTALPAEAYARGFYALYAKRLALDPTEILHRYTQERPKPSKSEVLSTLPQSKQAQAVGFMAERPSFMPFSFFGLTLLLLLLFGGFLCWYFSWNPATYLSQKLRSLENPQEIEQVSSIQTDLDISRPKFRSTSQQQLPSHNTHFFSNSTPSTATVATSPKVFEDPTQPHSETSKYYLDAVFDNDIQTSLTLNSPPLNLTGTDKTCLSNCLPEQFLQ